MLHVPCPTHDVDEEPLCRGTVQCQCLLLVWHESWGPLNGRQFRGRTDKGRTCGGDAPVEREDHPVGLVRLLDMAQALCPTVLKPLIQGILLGC